MDAQHYLAHLVPGPYADCPFALAHEHRKTDEDMSSVRGEASALQEEGVNAIVSFPFTSQPAIDFGGVDAPISQTVTISPTSLQPLETFISVVDTPGDV